MTFEGRVDVALHVMRRQQRVARIQTVWARRLRIEHDPTSEPRSAARASTIEAPSRPLGQIRQVYSAKMLMCQCAALCFQL
jgi:hypothetical protein